MSEYKPIRATDIAINADKVRIVTNSESQLDRIEKKMDRILELLEGKELSTSVEMDGKKVAEIVCQEIDETIKRMHERVLKSNRQNYGI